MIWFKDTIDKEGHLLPIEGRYNTPDASKPRDLIEIIITVDGKPRVIYSHNPTSLQQEIPTEEEVARKYLPKVRQISKKLLEKSLSEIRAWKD